MSGHLIIPDNNHYFESILSLIGETLTPKIKRMEDSVLSLRKQIKNEGVESSVAYSNQVLRLEYETMLLSQHLYGSFLLSVFFFMEYNLKRLCNYIQYVKKEPFNVQDIKGDGLLRLFKY